MLDTEIKAIDEQPQCGRRFRIGFEVEAYVSGWDTCRLAKGQSGCPVVQELWALI